MAIAATGPDAELLHLVKTLDQRWERTEVIAREMRQISVAYPGVTPRSRDAEARMDAAMDDWWEVMD